MPKPTTASTEVFFDPAARRIAKIYIDTVHLSGQLYIRLRNIIEDGGGRITPNKEAASIWIVDPDAPDALGNPSQNIMVLYAPWLIACARKGRFLGPDHGNWCGFKVVLKEGSTDDAIPTLTYPQSASDTLEQSNPFPMRSLVPSPPTQPVRPSRTADLNVDGWTSTAISEAWKYPWHPHAASRAARISGAPSPPPVHTLPPPNSVGKRVYNAAEQAWMVNVIQWCLSEYPDISMSTVCEILAVKGPHRTADGYTNRIRRHLQWFADRSPLLAERLCTYQDRPMELSYDDVLEVSDTETPPAQASHISNAAGQHGPTKFTQEDWDNFVRFAAVRPSGMEPTGMERALDIWEAFVKKHPNHSIQSWRTWYQHRQYDLKKSVEEYRRVHLRL